MVTPDPCPHVPIPADKALIRASVVGALRPEDAARARRLARPPIAAADELDGLPN